MSQLTDYLVVKAHAEFPDNAITGNTKHSFAENCRLVKQRRFGLSSGGEIANVDSV